MKIYLHVRERIQEFLTGEGGPGLTATKQLRQRFLVLNFFYSFTVDYLKENYKCSRFQRGSNIFPGEGCPTLSGVQMLISIETNVTCDFPGGGGLSSLWILTRCIV